MVVVGLQGFSGFHQTVAVPRKSPSFGHSSSPGCSEKPREPSKGLEKNYLHSPTFNINLYAKWRFSNIPYVVDGSQNP